ncbi:glycosyltransferase [Candidatus Woesearchaeota archaeon]|nr:glycosyltransferase [Candidatus Woesearchaeota archaeon]
MKKLLITTDCFLPRWDGVARFLSEAIPRLAEDFEVTVAAPEFEGRFERVKGVRYELFPLLKLRFGDIYFSRFSPNAISALVKESDIVFNQTIGPIGICAIRAASKHNVPIASYVHCIDWELAANSVKRFKTMTGFAVKWWARHLYNKCELLFVPSKEVEDVLSDNRIRTKKVLLPLGIDTEKFMPAISKMRAKKRVHMNPNNFVIGFVGRIGREKDLPTLKAAFMKLKKKYANTTLLIVGKGVDEEKLKGTDIVLAGRQENVVPWLQAMDVFVLPSLTETNSLATMEAMASGLPVAVTPAGSLKDYVLEGVNGYVFPRRDVEKLCIILERLHDNQSLRNALGKEARRTITHSYQFSDTVKRLRLLLSAASRTKSQRQR